MTKTVLERTKADAQAAAIEALIRAHEREFKELVRDELAKRGIFADRHVRPSPAPIYCGCGREMPKGPGPDGLGWTYSTRGAWLCPQCQT